MALEKISTVDRIEVLARGEVSVHTKTAILEDGEQITALFHGHVIAPGDDYSAEDARVQAICQATHTAELVATYAEEQAKIVPPLPKA